MRPSPRNDRRRIVTGEEKHARNLFRDGAAFSMSVARLEQLPVDEVPEIAFAGRSNVGKSSLLNALTTKDGLARTSNTPGRTQLLNLFPVGEPPLMRLVDMPGYGYAKAPKQVVEGWKRLVFDYLRGRRNLKRVMLLIDARRGPKPVDEEVMSLLDEAAVTYQLILTKSDKIKKVETVQELAAEAVRKRPAAFPEVRATSAEKNLGIDMLRVEILDTAQN
jgi:GTP-binding protein